jgi:hypothetical protein
MQTGKHRSCTHRGRHNDSTHKGKHSDEQGRQQLPLCASALPGALQATTTTLARCQHNLLGDALPCAPPPRVKTQTCPGIPTQLACCICLCLHLTVVLPYV